GADQRPCRRTGRRPSVTDMDRDDQAVELTGVSKRFGRVPAVAGLDLTVRAGQTVALLGPNRAGKTTTIRLLLGLIRPDAGGGYRRHRARAGDRRGPGGRDAAG